MAKGSSRALAAVDPVETMDASFGASIVDSWNALPSRTKYIAIGGVAAIVLVAIFRKQIAGSAAVAVNTLATAVNVKKVMPNAPVAKIASLLPDMIAALEEAQINTPLRVAAFLAQLGHESGDFRYFEELSSGDQYENREDLGNTQPGDGRRFKGRGPIQLTGRANYAAFTKDIGSKYGMDFVKNPELVADPKWGFKASAWFWNKKFLNTFADKGDFQAITYRINGGCNGDADRDKRYEAARTALGITGAPIVRKACSTYLAEVRAAKAEKKAQAAAAKKPAPTRRA